MTTYIDEQKKECTVKLTEVKTVDEWTKVVDLKPLKNVLEALKMLGKNIEGIYVHSVYLDLDKPYYARFPAESTDKIWTTNRRGEEFKVCYKNNRLYFVLDGKDIICPEDMYDVYSDCDNPQLTLIIRWA